MFQRDDRILVGVSGGKDSLTLWDYLLRNDYTAGIICSSRTTASW